MGKRRSGMLRIGLSKTGITVLCVGGWARKHSELVADCALSEEEAASPALLAARLRSMLNGSQCGGLPVRIVLADSWTRSWMVAPPHNAVRLSDCKMAAAARFQAVYGEPPTDWRTTADWDARQPFLACAVPQPLLSALLQVAADCKLVVLEIAPQFVVYLNRWQAELKAAAWFAALHENVLTIAVFGERRLHAVRAVALPPDAMQDKDCLPQILTREALRLNVPAPAAVQLCGQLPAHWALSETGTLRCKRLDAHRQAQGLPLSAGMMLAVTGSP
ncbi:MAG: hypothetical protein ACHP7O_08085 [Burkholderiales bacterium]